MMKIAISLALVSILLSTQGCAVLLTGYLIGDYEARKKATEQCRSNLRMQNEQRLKEGKDVFPDQCGQ